MVQHVSFDEYPDLYSGIALKQVTGNSRRSLRELVQAAPDYANRFLTLLPSPDQQISRLYYVEELSQDQISRLLGITQAAVSRRLTFIESRLRFLIKQPTQVPTQTAEEFEQIFPPDLVEFAFFFAFEYAQNRVKYFIKTSQSGAANKFHRVLSYLERLTALPEYGPFDPEEIRKLGLEGVPDYDIEDKRGTALSYLEFFRVIKSNSSVMAALFKKNDPIRANALKQGPSIF